MRKWIRWSRQFWHGKKKVKRELKNTILLTDYVEGWCFFCLDKETPARQIQCHLGSFVEP